MSNIHIMFIYIFLILLKTSLNYGKCGPPNYFPEGPEDCVGFSNSTNVCCFLRLLDAPADYQMCYSMNKTSVTAIMSNGKLTYLVDCTGVPDYDKLFPLEACKESYTACGVQNPMTAGDCWRYSSSKGACCIVSEREDMDSDKADRFCYYFPEVKYERKKFSIDITNKDDTKDKYYVRCKGFYWRVRNFIIAVSFFLIL